MANLPISVLPNLLASGVTPDDLLVIVNAGETKNIKTFDFQSYISTSSGFNLPIKNRFDNNLSDPLLLNLTILNLPTFSDSIAETVINYVFIEDSNIVTDVDINNLKTIGGDLRVVSNNSLTSVSLPNLTSIGLNNTFSSNYSLSNLNLSGLTSTGSGNYIANTLLTNLNLSNLTYVGFQNVIYDNSLLTNLDLSSLSFVGYNNTITQNNSLVTLNLDNLTTLNGSNNIWDNPLLTSLNLSNLTTVGSNIQMYNNNSLTTLDISNLATVGSSCIVNNNPSLTTIQVNPTGFTATGYYFDLNALSQTTVDNILVALSVSGAPPTNLDLSGGTNATPSATGLAAKATLVGLGWAVTNN